jgi:hypothetical protein
MKLWKCEAEHTDFSYSGMVVAEDEEKAMSKWKQLLGNEWYFAETVRHVPEIDGYKVVFRKGKKISLERGESYGIN